MISRPRINDRFATLVGGVLLLGMILSAWLPQPCSLLRRTLLGCPSFAPASLPPTPEQAALNLYPHQEVTQPYAFFSVKSQDYKKKTAVHFAYRGDLAHESAYLQVRKNTGFKDIALVTHPLLNKLKWSVIKGTNYRLYQRNPTFDSIDTFLLSLPPPTELIADEVAASQLKLSANQYVPLEFVTNLDQTNYILTTYSPPATDSGWSLFNQTFDIEDAFVNANRQIEWSIHFLRSEQRSKPFLLGTVHIDYTQMK